jgi:biotin carboxylase
MATILCIASYEKGQEFIRQCKREGWRVLLLTGESLQSGDWPRESLDDTFYLPDPDHEWNLSDMVNAVSYLARTEAIARVAALDDFDVEKAALLREHLRLPGMGDSVARHFRDKLAMRVRAQQMGLPIPRFVGLFHDDAINAFLDTTPGPYVLKPRTSAGAIGIQRMGSKEEAWSAIHALGDRRSFCLLEEFIPGDVYHVDSIVTDGQVVWSLASQYGRPPLETSHDGRVFQTSVLPRSGAAAKGLNRLNAATLTALGLEKGVSHTEFLRSEDGRFLFLETSARVGGAHISDMVEAASGLNLWAEWAKVELRENYEVVERRKEYAGLLLSLARQEWPDLSGFDDPEVVWTLKQRNHAGLIVRAKTEKRVTALLDSYIPRFYEQFHMALPPCDKPNH